MKHAVAIVLAATFVSGCSAERASTAASAEPAPTAAPRAEASSDAKPKEKTPLAQTKFGQPIAEGKPTELAAIASEPAKFAGQTVRTEGIVKAVCKSAGCWMEIGDAAGLAHVKMANHSFYVPKNADGHRARIEGTVKAGAPKDECGSKDSCGGEDNGALAKLEIEATGVEFLD
jgi:hypothetical protein